MNSDVQPLVSVVIPTYKRARFLARAVDSVLNQTYSNIEIVVVDDNEPGSNYRKDTQAIMNLYDRDIRVRYIQHDHNRNGAAARNTGTAASRGDYICYLDDDDWFLPDKLYKQIQFLKLHPQFEAVYCGYERDGIAAYPYKDGDLTFELLSGIEIIYTNTIMIKRESAVACGGWDERFRRNQEAVFLLHFFSWGGMIGALPEVLVQFDVSDAANRSDPLQHERDMDLFLSINEAEIERCRTRYTDSCQMIYSYRYRGVLLNFIKHGYWINALVLYRKMARALPGRFTRDCAFYIWRRLTGQAIFKEFEKERVDPYE